METFQDFTGSVPKDGRYNCLTVKRAHLSKMTTGSSEELKKTLENATEMTQEDSTKLDQILELVKEINSDDVQKVQASIERAILESSAHIFRTFDGSGNNLRQPSWGKANELLIRKSSPDFDPTQDIAIRGASNPNPRIISNSICKGTSTQSSAGLSDMAWAWGQFLDHEIDLTPTQEPPEYPTPETLNIVTPSLATDPNENYPGRTIPFTRSAFSKVSGVRQQPNIISSFVDATNVYGSNVTRAFVLRRLDGTGKLKTTTANNGEILPPYNFDKLPNAAPGGSNPEDFFLCGDIRSNEQALLTSMHALMVREHNRLCDVFAANDSNLSEEMLYQKARRFISGFMQQITYAEFLPALLGSSVVSGPGTATYNSSINTSIATEFSTVGYRIGHSMISPHLALGPNASSSVPLRDIFFVPSYLQQNGCDDLLIGATKQLSQEIDGIIVEDLRSFLFGPPSATLMHDLASLNIQRGRDHGIGAYNDLRQAYGLTRISNFSSLPTTSANQTKLENLYDNVDDIDPWVMGISETHLPDCSTGPLFFQIIKTQFDALKYGDRFWFENDSALSSSEITTIKNTSLRDIMIRNTQYSANDFNANVFHVPLQ